MFRTIFLASAILAGLLAIPAGAVFTLDPVPGIVQVGDVVTLSGMNSDNTTTFLFVTGPYLDDNGVMLTNTSQPVGGSYFDNATVNTNFTWSFAWNTSLPEVKLWEGPYVIFAARHPLPRKELLGPVYAQQTIYFRGGQQPAAAATTAAPTPVPTWTPPPAGVEVEVSSSPSDDYPGRIDGDLIVYEARRGDGGSDVYLYNIKSGETTPVATGAPVQTSPSMNGKRIVYSAYEVGRFNNRTDADLYLYDITTGATERLAMPGDQLNPRIFGDLLAWQDESPGHSSVNVFISDLVTGARVKVPARMWAYSPDLSGGRAIFLDDPVAPAVYLYDIQAKTVRRVTNKTGIRGTPMLDGNRITWADSRNDYFDVFVLDLGTGGETQVTSGSRNHFSPAISGDRVVWSDFKNGNWDIYMYDLPTGRTSEITTSLGDQVDPRISGCTVAWADSRNGSYDVYYMNIAACTASPTPAPVSLQPEATPLPVTQTTVSAPATPYTIPAATPSSTTPVPPPTAVPTTEAPGPGAAHALAGLGILLLIHRARRLP